MVDRFKQEAITIAQLHHPNIVSVYSVRQAEGLHFFVMRYVQGRSLEQVIQQAGRLPLPIVRSILFQVGSALTYAHRARRDPPGHQARQHPDRRRRQRGRHRFRHRQGGRAPSQTLTGALVGTPAYMSPEQCSGGEVSGRVGPVRARRGGVRDGDRSAAVLGLYPDRDAGARRAGRRARCASVRADCPPEVEAAILRMLDKDADAALAPTWWTPSTALGAEPLAEDDPLRGELIGHAASTAGGDSSDMPTPTSPAPRTKASSRARLGRPAGGRHLDHAGAAGTRGGRQLHPRGRDPRASTAPASRPVRSNGAPTRPPCCGSTRAGGLATALAPGSAHAHRHLQGRQRACSGWRSSRRKADDIVIEPVNEPLHAGEEIRLEATPRDKRGWPVYRTVIWQSADPEVAAVTPAGTIAGRRRARYGSRPRSTTRGRASSFRCCRRGSRRWTSPIRRRRSVAGGTSPSPRRRSTGMQRPAARARHPMERQRRRRGGRDRRRPGGGAPVRDRSRSRLPAKGRARPCG